MLWYEEIENLDVSKYQFIKDSKKIERCNIEAAFDIETTSIYYKGEKHAFMYIWMFGIDKYIYYGRTWEQFISFTDKLSSRLETYPEKRLVVYVHVLQFEFQFIHQLFEWEKVFSLKPHKPIYALSSNGIEFRCSYLLSGLNLEKTAANLLYHKLDKKIGQLDYDKIRHHLTPLEEEELEYCEYDIRILLAYINEQISEYGNNINRIPMTNTGRVRNFCRKNTLGVDYQNYRTLMASLQLTPEDYLQLKDAFQGGFTHANYNYVEKVVRNVASYDLASSYPAVMITELYPMSSPVNVQIESSEHFYELLNNYCCLFDIEFKELTATKLFENPLSESKCSSLKGATVNNGRIMMADKASTTMTEQDFYNIRQFYEWKSATITNMKIMKKGYLPKNFILSILKLYQAKTTLKGVQGKEAEYMRSKNMINSAYGMAVTDIARDDITFQSTGEWKNIEADLDTKISIYNRSKRRFLYYPWGVWVTAYARRNLFSAILEYKDDYVYSDTDSVKVVNKEKHEAYIERYNDNIEEKLRVMCEEYDIDIEMTCPIDPKGERQMIGVWKYEGTYSRFKTLGAKRYMVEEGGEVNITVAGVNKKKAVPYIKKAYKDPFEAFQDGLIIPADWTGKLTHTYIEEDCVINVTDYTGIKAKVRCRSGVHLEKAPYELSISAAYADFLKGYRLVD